MFNLIVFSFQSNVHEIIKRTVDAKRMIDCFCWIPDYVDIPFWKKILTLKFIQLTRNITSDLTPSECFYSVFRQKN